MIQEDAERVCDLISSRRQVGGRTIVAIAGPPASGKSTLAEAVVHALNAQQDTSVPHAALFPMDGYHLDNRVLEARGLLSRKGAPETFDAHGFCSAIKTIQTAEYETFHPVFDRNLDLAIANAIPIHPNTPVVVAEGNYLLMEQDPWTSLADVFSATVFVCPTLEELKIRLRNRWLQHGFDPKTALERASRNDLPNAELVLRSSRKADLTLSQNDSKTGAHQPF